MATQESPDDEASAAVVSSVGSRSSADVTTIKHALLKEEDPDLSTCEALSREDVQALLAQLLVEGSACLTGATNSTESSAPFINNFGRFCSVCAGRGLAELAEDLNAAVPENKFSIPILVALLGGDSGTNFSFDLLQGLLIGLDVDWGNYGHLGDLACSLLAWPDCNSDPIKIGRLLRALALPEEGDGFFATEDIVDVTNAVLEDEWDAMLAGKIAKGMMPCWDCERVLDVIEILIARFMESDACDIKKFELNDTAGPQNKAMQFGVILDCFGVPEAKVLDLSVQFLTWFWQNFPEEDEPQEDDPPLVCCMRGTWFAGRVLQQVCTCHDPEYIPLLTRSWFGGSWKAPLAISLACRLTACDPESDESDWRFNRKRHAYHVGALLFQLRERWWTAELTQLVQELRQPRNFQDSGPSPPSRIVAEVLEGMNADWEPRLPRLQALEKAFWARNHSPSPSPSPQPDSPLALQALHLEDDAAHAHFHFSPSPLGKE